MNVEFINACIKGAKQTLDNLLSIDSEVVDTVLKQELFKNQININIEILGDLKGIFNYSFSYETALFIASKMMFLPVKNLDDISKSALAELSNMISGAISINFFNIGKKIDITTPKFLEDFKDFKYDKFICTNIMLDEKNLFNLNIWIEE